MGAWGLGVTQSDEYMETYEAFMERYDEGEDVADIAGALLEEYIREFGPEDGVLHDKYFAIAKAQWMCGGVQPEIMQKVEEIIGSGANLAFLEDLVTDPKDLRVREKHLARFLASLKTPRPTVRKRRPRPKASPAKPASRPEYAVPDVQAGSVIAYRMPGGLRMLVCLGVIEFFGTVPVLCFMEGLYDRPPEPSALLDASIGMLAACPPPLFHPKDAFEVIGCLPEVTQSRAVWRIPEEEMDPPHPMGRYGATLTRDNAPDFTCHMALNIGTMVSGYHEKQKPVTLRAFLAGA